MLLGARSIPRPHGNVQALRPDEELLEAWRAGDTAAGGELFDRYFEPVRRFFLNKTDADVEDLVQQTFLACVNARDRLEKTVFFRGYLFKVARSKLIDSLRGHARRTEELDPERDSLNALGLSPSGVLGKTEEQELLLQALRALPLDLQIAVELYYFENVNGAELVEALQIPGGTVRSRIRRGLEKLREELERLMESPELRRQTLTRLDEWAQQIREQWDGE